MITIGFFSSYAHFMFRNSQITLRKEIYSQNSVLKETYVSLIESVMAFVASELQTQFHFTGDLAYGTSCTRLLKAQFF